MAKLELPTDDEVNDGNSQEETEVSSKPTDSPEENQTQVTDDTVVTITVDGEEKEVTVKEMREGFMRTSDYTRKTQTLAEEKRQIAAAVEKIKEREKGLNDLISDPNRLMQLASASMQTNQKEPDLQDEDVLTVGQVKKLLMEERAQVARALQQDKVVQSQQQVVQQMEAKANQAFDKVFAEVPDLKQQIPFVEDVLKKMALDYKPEDLDQMSDAIIKAGGKLAKQLGFDKKKTSPTDSKNKLEGIEPPGGSVIPPPADKVYHDPNKKGKVDWKALEKDATEWMESAMGGKS